jgi:hypothetical protein
MTTLEKIYVINLSDREDRFEKLQKIDSRIERLPAVDTRTDIDSLTEYNLRLAPAGLAAQIYFSTARGAVGAYLSHYTCWKKMLNSDASRAMIIEDDININDLVKFLDTDYEFNDLVDFYQLGKRTQPSGLVHNFDGFECYVINRRAAKILIKTTHDRDHFNGIIEPHIPPRLAKGIFNNEPPTDWSEHDTISCPVDKLAGYCAHPKLPPVTQIRIELAGCVDLDPDLITSDINNPGIRPWWNWSPEQVTKYITTDKNFKFWEPGE